MKNYFSKNLKFLREQKKLSQNKLGELANVNQTTIARWENEEMAPSIDNVIELSKIFNIDLNLDNLYNVIEEQTGIQSVQYHFVIEGICTDCQK